MPLPILSAVPPIDTLELEGKRVLIRVDLNTPFGDDAERIRELRVQAALPSIRHACDAGAKVIVAAHLGHPRGKPRADLSLDAAGLRLAELLETELYLPEDVVGDSAKKVIFDLRDGQICLLENLAFHPGEEQNDEGFALELARLFDIYVNDAPGALDQKLASMVLLPRYSRQWAVGLTLSQELRALERLASPKAPFVSIVRARSHEAASLDVLDSLALKSNTLCLGGTLATAFAVAQGRGGDATFPHDVMARCRTLIGTCRDRGVELCLLPDDPSDIERAASIERASERIRSAGTVIAYGRPPATQVALASTRWLVETLTKSNGFSAVIGDDAVLATLEAAEDLTTGLGFVAKSGFPALKLLRGDPLPGLEALAALA